MSVLVKALGYYSHKGGRAAGGLRRIKAHLKYLEHGKEHLNRPVGFDADRDEVSRREFLDGLAAQPQRGVIAHKLVFSLSQAERDRLGIEMRDLVRETMAAYQAETGRALRWIGFEHDDPGHPHVHVVVAGYDRSGKQVGLYPRDLAALREVAGRERDRLADLSRATGLVREERAAARLAGTAEQDRSPVLEGLWQRVRQLLERPQERSPRLPVRAPRQAREHPHRAPQRAPAPPQDRSHPATPGVRERRRERAQDRGRGR